jgi:beta-glucosidase
VSVDVRNAGERAGDEVVQLYVRDVVASVSRPVKELKGFRRVSLQPKETRRVTFTLTPRDLSLWTARGWVAEPGTFQVWVGTLAGSFEWSSTNTTAPPS